MAGKPRRLVVDASLAGPAPQVARDALHVIEFETEHAAVFDPKLVEEWERHQTSFSRSWRVRMHGRKRIVAIDALPALPWERHLEKVKLRPTQKSALEKDLHLIRAAAATDETILSRDRRALGLFCEACAVLPDLGRIVWANPDRPEEEVLAWLRAGAKPEESRQIRNAPPGSGA